MSIFARLFGGGDPTQKWVANWGLGLDFDFETHALCGVRLGEPLERLSRLGPAEDSRAARDGSFLYYSKGLEVGVEGGRINRYALFWRDFHGEGYQPFAGTCRDKGRPLMLSPNTTEREIKALFGEPYWRHTDEPDEEEPAENDPSETSLFYEFGDTERIVTLTPDGRLMEIEIITPPTLANEGYRKMYDVTKAWPPQDR